MQVHFAGSMRVLLIERIHTLEEVHRLALQQKWFGTAAMWTIEKPWAIERIPTYAVLDANGVVVLRGGAVEDGNKVWEYFERHHKSWQHLPDGLPATLAPIWKLAIAGDLSEAWQQLAKHKEGTGRDRLRKKLVEFAEAKLAELDRALSGSDFPHAERICRRLGNGAPGTPFAAQVATHLERLRGMSAVRELVATRALEPIEAALNEKGADQTAIPLLVKLASDHPGTRAANRARLLVRALGPASK